MPEEPLVIPPVVDPPPEPKTFSQDDLNRIAKQTKVETAKAERAAVLADLGIEDVESGKARLEALKQSEEAQKSEALRAKEAADAERSLAAKERSEAALERHSAKIERQLVRAELPADLLDDASVLVGSKLQSDASDDEIAAEVKALKERMPQLFASKAGVVNSHVAGRSPTSQTVNETDPLTAGAERAKQHKASVFGRLT